ncbi:hypothetical protein LSAT2_032450 [Lamellibrachia satsuma]|nr:hypothetical protein LSAT2_032450 [Lamellibrachia satsuma]
MQPLVASRCQSLASDYRAAPFHSRDRRTGPFLRGFSTMTIFRSVIEWLPVLTYGAAIAGHTVFTQWRAVTINITVLDKT